MIGEIIRSLARQTPAAPALLAPGRPTLDYRGLADHLREVGAALNEGGVGQGDRVALVLANGPEAAAAFLAVSCFAAVLPVPDGVGLDVLRDRLGPLQPLALVADPLHAPLARSLAAEFQAPLLTLEADPDGPAGRFTLHGQSAARRVARPGPSDPDADALLLQTSGTTGRPRTVPLTHRNLLASVAGTVDRMALTPADRGLCLAPFFHKLGLVTGLMVPLASGGSVIFPPAFEAAAFFHWLVEEKPTWYVASPVLHQAVLRQAPARPEAVRDHRLRFIRSGAAPLPVAVHEELERVFAVPVIEAYGMSEAGIACNPLPPGRRKPGTVGLPLTEVAVMGPGGRRLAAGERGEIAVRGPSVTRGYVNSPRETAERFRGGWFYTGDQGCFDPDGYLIVVGRLQEVINRGGRKVDPRPVEDLLLRHPEVREAAAFPAAHPTLGDDLVAAVVLAAGATVTPQALRDYLFRHRPAPEVPSRIVVVEAIPRSATGKVERTHLASRLEGRLRMDYVAPKSALESALAHCFAEVLQVKAVGLHDHFYALGGDSLKLVELILLLEKKLNRRVSDDVTMAELTPAGLRTFLTAHRPGEPDEAPVCPGPAQIRLVPSPLPSRTVGRLLRPLTARLGRRPRDPSDPSSDFDRFHLMGCHSSGRRPPLFWCFQQWFECRALSEALGGGQPLFGVRSGFPPHRSASWRRLLGERYAGKIMEIQPHGPVSIGGNCSGAYVAWEIARALQSRNRQIDPLFLMEATIMRPYPGRVVLLYGRESLAFNPFLAGRDPLPEWQSLYGRHDLAELPGNHGEYFEPRNVPALAEILHRHLPARRRPRDRP